MDPALIALPLDLPTGPGLGPVGSAGPALSTVPVPRFADLLASAASTSAPPPAVQAERFNEDGFFATILATPSAMTPPAPLSASFPVENGVVPLAVATMIAAPVADAMGGSGHAPAPVPLAARPPVSAPRAIAPIAAARVATAKPVFQPRPAPRRAPGAPPPPRPPIRQRPVPPGSFVAVAVQVVAQGIEVAAQVAQIDERDRAALSEEVAALLAAHGFVPARITIAATGGARQDHH